VKAAAPEPALAAFAGVSKGQLVLDAAGGEGRQAAELAAAGARVLLLDRSADALAGAGDAARLGVARVRGDLRALPFPAAAFDAVILRAVLHHLTDPAVGLREAARVAKPGGVVVLVDKTVPVDAEARAVRNALERLRHRGHAWSHTERELANLAGSASLDVESITAWADERPVEEWAAMRGIAPPFDGLLRELLASERVRRTGAVRIRPGPDGAEMLEQTWASLRLRKRGSRR
jgi:ubiquinone/menaquinone biosynthesis C-methylase UbiE